MAAERRPVLKAILALALTGLAGFLWWQRYHYPYQRAANERNALACLKSLAAAEADFRNNDRDGNGIRDFWTGDVAGLFTRGKLIDSHLAHMDIRPLGSQAAPPWDQWGYYLLAMDTDGRLAPPEELRQETDNSSGKVHHLSKFAFCAYPVKYGSLGHMTFIINEGNTVFRQDNGGKPVLRWPSDKQILAEWAPAD